MPHKFSGNIYVNNYCCLVFISRQQILRDKYIAYRQYLHSLPTPSVQTVTVCIFSMYKGTVFYRLGINNSYLYFLLWYLVAQGCQHLWYFPDKSKPLTCALSLPTYVSISAIQRQTFVFIPLFHSPRKNLQLRLIWSLKRSNTNVFTAFSFYFQTSNHRKNWSCSSWGKSLYFPHEYSPSMGSFCIISQVFILPAAE